MRLALAMGCALMLVAAAPATADAKLHSFEGTCAFEGTSEFSPPATNEQQALDVRYTGHGTCDGTLDGRSLTDEPVLTRTAYQDVDGSCRRADTTKPGDGLLIFPDGTTIGFASEFHFVGTEGEFALTGSRGGSAHGHGSFITDRTPPDLLLQCAGEGVSEAPLDITLTTDSPLVSKSPRGRARR